MNASLLCLALAALGRTIHVPGDMEALQPAIDQAGAGDTVLVAPGVYAGPGFRDVTYGGKAIVVRSESGSGDTVIDVQASADDPHRAFFFGSGEPREALLEGFTIRNGHMGDAPSFGAGPSRRHNFSGGGFQVQTSSPTIRDVVVESCGSQYTGGGVSIEIGSTPWIERLVVRGCTSDQGGGGITVELGSAPVLRDCVITGNSSLLGGGLFSTSSSPVFEGCLITGNLAELGGGVYSAGPSGPALQRAVVWGNCARSRGAQVFQGGVLMSFTCSLLDSSGVVRETEASRVEYDPATRFEDPRFCGPKPCADAPLLLGDYTVGTGSPCLPALSPCGQVIGVLGAGSCAGNAVIRMSWGRLKRALLQ